MPAEVGATDAPEKRHIANGFLRLTTDFVVSALL